VASIRDPNRLVETVANRIADSLHVPRVAFLLQQGGLFRPAYALGFNGAAPSVQLPENASAIRTLKRLNGPSKVYFDDPQSWVHGASEPEQTALQTLETQVLLPVTLDTKILGIISLGAKKSELPYSKADLQLLSAVAAQTGLALENAHLTESIRREVASRERLNRELEIARDVQQRLFPQKLPQVNGLDFAGYCRPAQGVGGDYYDFIHLANGSLGIAVGDVSGKGIAAALMMASLQASLRGQTIKPCETLCEMIRHINSLVYEASAASRYATFFYAQYNPECRKLRYVNAGHNPPMLRRQSSNGYQFLRLEEGGTVIGLFPDFPYKEAEIELQSGDILVAYTDGISEAMNHADEEFDEERLMDAIRTCPDRSAANISNYIMEKVDAFTAGADQHDDMTIVVVRLL
jgi:sigma-B regulation protein RsbU (phosphoserine phosphatase)